LIYLVSTNYTKGSIYTYISKDDIWIPKWVCKMIISQQLLGLIMKNN
jgi:hypothetical protein